MSKNKFKGRQRVRFSAAARQHNYEQFSLNELHRVFITAKEAEGLRERTIKDHINHYKYFVRWLEKQYGMIPLQKLSVHLIREYIGFMRNELELSPVTVNVRIRTLKCFLKFLFDEKYLNEDLSSLIKLLKTEEDTLEILTDDHIKALLKVINKNEYTGFRDYALIMLLIDTGMRIGEAVSLTTDHVDFQQRFIYLSGRNVKNRKGRVIPLSQKVNRILFDLVKFNEQSFGCKEIFLSVYGTPFQKRSVQKRLTQYKEKANITDARVSPHSFRHYFAKTYILEGGDPFTLQQILGHSDMQMVRRYIQMTATDTKIQHNQYSPIKKLNL